MDKNQQEICLEIYENNKAKIYWYLRKHNPGLAEDDVFDIMQDVWAALVKSIGTVELKDEDGRTAWLYKVCITKASDWFRKRERANNLDEKIQSDSKQIYSHDPVPDIVMDKIEALEILNELTESERKTFFSNFWETPEAVDEKVSKNAVTCRVYRVRKKIEERLGMRKGKNDEKERKS